MSLIRSLLTSIVWKRVTRYKTKASHPRLMMMRAVPGSLSDAIRLPANPVFIPDIYIDSDMTRRVIINLLDNGLKYSSEGLDHDCRHRMRRRTV